MNRPTTQRRTRGVIALLAIVSVGCVSVTSPTAAPTAVPGPTALATPEQTAAPTPAPPSPSAEPSAIPTASSGTEPSPSAAASVDGGTSPSPGTGFPADTPLFTDDFSDTASVLWGTGTQEQGTIAYADGALRIAFTLGDRSQWSWRRLDEVWSVVRIGGSVTLSPGPGAAGWMCGAAPDAFVGGVINNDGEWVFIEVVAGSTTSLDRGPLPSTLPATTTHDITLECAGTGTGALRLRMLVDDQEIATYERDTGLQVFDRVAVYADTTQPGFTATFDDAEAAGGDGSGGFPGS